MGKRKSDIVIWMRWDIDSGRETSGVHSPIYEATKKMDASRKAALWGEWHNGTLTEPSEPTNSTER